MTRPFAVLFIALAGLVVFSACGTSSKSSAVQPAPSSVTWPAPSDPMTLAHAAGLTPETAERLQYHVHSHLDVFVEGDKVVVPAGLGIDIKNPGVHTFVIDGANQYGGINPPCDAPCISPLHTHDVSGVLHTESATKKNNTLGQLFVEWNVKLSKTCVDTYCTPAKSVAVYVDGKQFSGDPTTIPLSDHKEIAIVIGTPPAQIPATYDWSSI
jgi:hypothetical protein